MGRVEDEESRGERDLVCDGSVLLDLLMISSQGKAAWSSSGAWPLGGRILAPEGKNGSRMFGELSNSICTPWAFAPVPRLTPHNPDPALRILEMVLAP